MPKIVDVIPQDDHTLVVKLDNGHIIVYDLKPRLKAVRFANLANIEMFKSLQIENGNVIVWDSLCQITIDEIIIDIQR